MNEPLVSILIPAFNAERWIAVTIESALEQTWQRKEIIVVDDGSTDRTLRIVRQFPSSAVRVVEQANRGAAVARNVAYGASRGDYIQWLDADDLLAPDKISKQMETLDASSSKRMLLSSAWGYFIHRWERARFVPSVLWMNLSPVEWLLANLENGVFLANASWLVSRELTEAAGPWDTRLSFDDDGEYFSRVVAASDGVRFVRDAKMYYRRSGGESLSNIDRTSKKCESFCLSIHLQIANIRSLEESETVRLACLKYLQRYLVYFYPERLDIVRQLELLANNLGGELKVPRLSWKYTWIQKSLGWTAAKRAQRVSNQVKLATQGFWDAALFHLEKRRGRPGGSEMMSEPIK